MHPIISIRIAGFATIALMILSSCELQKRRYSKGYYVSLQTSKTQGGNNGSNQQLQTETKMPEREIKKIAESAAPEIQARPIAEKNADSRKDKASGGIVTYTPGIVISREQALPGYLSLSNPQKTSARKSEQSNKNKLKTTVENDNGPKNLKNDIEQKRKRRAALIIGISILLMAAVAAFAAPAISSLFVLAEPALTTLNVVGAMSKFRAAVIGWIIIFVLDVLISIGVHKYYKEEKSRLAITTGILRLVYSAFLGIGIAQLLRAATSAPTGAIYGLLNSFHNFWNWGLIVFGLHLIILGILYHNEGGKKWVNITIKVLLILAGIGYMALYIGVLIAPNPIAFAAIVEPIFLIPQLLGEVLFAIWMLVKGGKQNVTK